MAARKSRRKAARSKADREFVCEAEEILERMREELANLHDQRSGGGEVDPDLVNGVFRSAHSDIMKRRKEWFDRIADNYLVLWWVPTGHQPTEQEAGEKLQYLRQNGPSAQAFSFRERFDAPQ